MKYIEYNILKYESISKVELVLLIRLYIPFRLEQRVLQTTQVIGRSLRLYIPFRLEQRVLQTTQVIGRSLRLRLLSPHVPYDLVYHHS